LGPEARQTHGRDHDHRDHNCRARAPGSRPSFPRPESRNALDRDWKGLRGASRRTLSHNRSRQPALRRARAPAMIIDTSAIIAILRDELEAQDFARAIEAASSRRISCVNWVEAAVVIDGSRDPIASRRFDELVTEAQLNIEPVNEVQARIAREA